MRHLSQFAVEGGPVNEKTKRNALWVAAGLLAIAIFAGVLLSLSSVANAGEGSGSSTYQSSESASSESESEGAPAKDENDSEILDLEIDSQDELDALLSSDSIMLASDSGDDASTAKTVDINITKNWEGDNADDRPSYITVTVQHKNTSGTTVTDRTVKITPDEDGNWKATVKGLPYMDENGNRINYVYNEAFGTGGNNDQGDYGLSVVNTTKSTTKNLELWALVSSSNNINDLAEGAVYTIGTGITHDSQVLRPEGPTEDVMSGTQYVFNAAEGDDAETVGSNTYATYTYFGVGDTSVENALGWTAVKNSDGTWSFKSNMEEVDPQLNRTVYLSYAKGSWKIASNITDSSKFNFDDETGAISPVNSKSTKLYLFQKIERDDDLPNYITAANLCNTYSAPDTPGSITTLESGSLTLNVSKTWDDDEDSADKRPDSVTVRILADGEDTGKSVTLTAANNWQTKVTGLDIYRSDGKTRINYTLQENDDSLPEGYTSTVSYGDEEVKETYKWVQWDSFGYSSLDDDSYLVLCYNKGQYSGLYWNGSGGAKWWVTNAPTVSVSGGVRTVEKEEANHDNPVALDTSSSGDTVTITATKDWAKTLADTDQKSDIKKYEMMAEEIRVKVYANGEYLGEDKDIVLNSSNFVKGSATNSALVDPTGKWGKWTNSGSYPVKDDNGATITYTTEVYYATVHNSSVEDSLISGTELENCIWDTTYRGTYKSGGQSGTYPFFSMHNHKNGTANSGYMKFNGKGDVTSYKDGEGDIHYGIWPQSGVKYTLSNPSEEWPYVLANAKHYYLTTEHGTGDASADAASIFYVYKKVKVVEATQDVTLTNTYKETPKDETGSIKIHKIDDEGNSLAGATFTLYSTATTSDTPYVYKASDGTETKYYPVTSATTIVDGTETQNSSAATTPSSGDITFSNLALTTKDKSVKYLLVETEAPEGFTAIDPIEVGSLPITMAGSTYKDITYTATDKRLVKLPQSGGSGIAPLTLVGAIAMIGCVYGYFRTRQTRGGVKG